LFSADLHRERVPDVHGHGHRGQASGPALNHRLVQAGRRPAGEGDARTDVLTVGWPIQIATNVFQPSALGQAGRD
jgi:hypothetical protein